MAFPLPFVVGEQASLLVNTPTKLHNPSRNCRAISTGPNHPFLEHVKYPSSLFEVAIPSLLEPMLASSSDAMQIPSENTSCVDLL